MVNDDVIASRHIVDSVSFPFQSQAFPSMAVGAILLPWSFHSPFHSPFHGPFQHAIYTFLKPMYPLFLQILLCSLKLLIAHLLVRLHVACSIVLRDCVAACLAVAYHRISLRDGSVLSASCCSLSMCTDMIATAMQ